MTLQNSYKGLGGPVFPRAPIRWASPEDLAAGVCWWWPEEGKVRARKLLSRAAMRPIYRFTSLKMGRSIHLESALEHQVALLLDACPLVDAFAEQPVQMEFDNGKGMSRHFPDFALSYCGKPWFLELKYVKDVDAACRQRTQQLTELLAPLGIGYRLVTEQDLPQRDRVTNAWALLQRGRQTVGDQQRLVVFQRVFQQQGISLGKLGWNTPATGAALASELMQGRLHADLSTKLSMETPVFTTPVQEGWLWA